MHPASRRVARQNLESRHLLLFMRVTSRAREESESRRSADHRAIVPRGSARHIASAWSAGRLSICQSNTDNICLPMLTGLKADGRFCAKVLKAKVVALC